MGALSLPAAPADSTSLLRADILRWKFETRLRLITFGRQAPQFGGDREAWHWGPQRATRYICDPRPSAIFDLQAHYRERYSRAIKSKKRSDSRGIERQGGSERNGSSGRRCLHNRRQRNRRARCGVPRWRAGGG